MFFSCIAGHPSVTSNPTKPSTENNDDPIHMSSLASVWIILRKAQAIEFFRSNQSIINITNDRLFPFNELSLFFVGNNKFMFSYIEMQLFVIGK